MAHITKIAAVETTTAIWEYDPSLPDNHVLNGSLDIIAAICMVAIKVCLVLFHFRFLSDEPFPRARFRCLVNESSYSKTFRLSVGLWIL
jgi:hypothetical protein